MQLPERSRLDVIAEGLGLLVEHVQALRDDLWQLAQEERPRGFAVLAAFGDEEAAKVLVLLDLVRMGWRDPSGSSKQLHRFYEHLARCIYAELEAMRPADFREVRSIVDSARSALYLDGPNDYDWIFRNQLIARREESLYVDYVHDEDGNRWTSPARYDSTQFGYLTTAQDLIASMHRIGLTSRGGLDVIAQAWVDQLIADDTHWQEVRALNWRIIQELDSKGLMLADVGQEDVQRVHDRWGFPLTSLDLSERKVTEAQLRAVRDRRLADYTG
jgi:hypothetical protein